jgi:hypothetical protein
MKCTLVFRPNRSAGPVMRMTGYDAVISVLITFIMAMLLTIGAQLFYWRTESSERNGSAGPNIGQHLVFGGVASSQPELGDTSLMSLIMSPENRGEGELGDPHTGNVMPPSDLSQIQVELESDQSVAANAVPDIFDAGDPAARPGAVGGSELQPGAVVGGRGRLLSDGVRSERAQSRQHRWVIEFPGSSVGTYARLLDHFEIALAVSYTGTDRVIVLRPMSGATPVAMDLSDISKTFDTQMSVSWGSEHREEMDRALVRSAGLSVDGASIMLLYPTKLVAQMEQLEAEFSGRSISSIRATYFAFELAEPGFRLVVRRQTTK